MKIVYTPIFEKVASYQSNHLYNTRFFDIACFLLSVSLSQKIWNHIEVRTTPSFGMFVQKIFPDVVVVDQEKQPYGKHNWQMNKIISYSKQNEPFIHVDNDVFFSKPQDLGWWNKGFLTQSFESLPNKASTIRSVYFTAKMRGHILPAYAEQRAIDENWTQYNMGIFGAIDIESCHKFCNDVMGCVGNGAPVVGQSMLYEQFCFAAFAEANKLPVAAYINEGLAEIECEERGYCHLMGGKSEIDVMAQTIDSLGRHNPEALFALYKNFSPKTGQPIQHNSYDIFEEPPLI